MRTLQKFVSIHSSVRNHFNQERHLYSRENYKLNRAAALPEWRQLGIPNPLTKIMNHINPLLSACKTKQDMTLQIAVINAQRHYIDSQPIIKPKKKTVNPTSKLLRLTFFLCLKKAGFWISGIAV